MRFDWEHRVFFCWFTLHFIKASLIDSVVLVAAVWQSEPVTCAFLCDILFSGAALSHDIQ